MSPRRRLPGGRAAKGRSYRDFRPDLPIGPAGAVVRTGNGTTPERPAERQPPEEPKGQASDDPHGSSSVAADSAATQALALPLLGQVGQSLLATGKLNTKLIARQQRRQALTLAAFQAALVELAPGGRIARYHDQVATEDFERLRRAALVCYRLAVDSFQVSRALFTPVLHQLAEQGETVQTPAAPSATAADPDPWAEAVDVATLNPRHEQSRRLAELAHEVLVTGEEKQRELPSKPRAISLVDDDLDVQVVVVPQPPAVVVGTTSAGHTVAVEDETARDTAEGR